MLASLSMVRDGGYKIGITLLIGQVPSVFFFFFHNKTCASKNYLLKKDNKFSFLFFDSQLQSTKPKNPTKP